MAVTESQPRKEGPYVSTYLQIKADIEALEEKKKELARSAEAARLAELEVEVVDMKKRIIAFGIQPHMLFSQEELHGKGVKRPRKSAGHSFPIKFRHESHEWSGTGSMPNWFADALRAGMKPEQMLVPGVQLGRLPKGTHRLMGTNGAGK
jgi:DNA-binding protein H-NS